MPPESKEPISVTSLAGEPVAQHGVKLTTLGAVVTVLQAPKPRMVMMESNASVSFISIVTRLYAKTSLDDKLLFGIPKKTDPEDALREQCNEAKTRSPAPSSRGNMEPPPAGGSKQQAPESIGADERNNILGDDGAARFISR